MYSVKTGEMNSGKSSAAGRIPYTVRESVTSTGIIMQRDSRVVRGSGVSVSGGM